ncbi:MAG: hypothetical protein J4G04_01160 [Nitrosopumilaceae archaeon]|nr:hypothetical protein [Nitrosopumilaceae archaeon]
MAVYRTRVRLIGEIMSYAEVGASVSDMARRAGASYYRVSSLLRTLACQGLVERAGETYRISPRGRDFLREYQTFRQYSESIGMTV